MTDQTSPGFAIHTSHLTKRFGDHVVISDVDLEIRRDEIFGLVGPNGAGKSTLIKMLTTLLPPSSGSAEVAGFDIVRSPAAVRRSIGYVPQVLSADGMLTGYENLLLSARLYGIPRKERSRRIAEALAMTGLAEAQHKLAAHYSGGMLRRLEIAQSTLHRPQVLIMDEPTVGLDPVARHAVWDHIRDLRQSFGTTILLTSHMMDEVEKLCDRVGILHNRKLVRAGTPSDLKASLGPDATLDDVFAAIAGQAADTSGDIHDIQRERRSAAQHG